MKFKIPSNIITIAFALTGSISALRADDSKEPQPLATLRDSYQRAIERAVSPVQEKYIEELKKLRVRYTKDGKLEEAIVVDKELTKMLALNDKSDGSNKMPTTLSGPDHLFGEWYCNDIETDIYIIKSDKKAFHATDTGTWVTNKTHLIITWANGFRTFIQLDQVEDTVHVQSLRPGAQDYDVLEFTRKNRK